MDERQISELLQQAVALHNGGNLADAEPIYRRILAERPTNADALHLLGVLLAQRGRTDLGLPLLQQAVALLPTFAQFQLHLGEVLAAMNRHEEALQAFEKAVQINPRDPAARQSAGASLFALNRFPQALEQFRIALELAPNDGVKLGNYGYALSRLGRSAEAIDLLHRAVELAPHSGAAWMQLAESLWRLHRFDEAVPPARRAIELTPTDPRALVLFGNTCQTVAAFQEAAGAYQRALQLDPNHFDAASNLALTFLKMGQAQQSLALYDQIRARWPNSHDVLANRSLALLTLGDLSRGFADYEARWRTALPEKYHFAQPRWDGGDPRGQTILLMNEQGLGDTVHFVRYAPLLSARGARVLVACPPALRPLIETVNGVATVVSEEPGRSGAARFGDDAPPFDLWAPLSSLPWLFNTTLETIPAPVPYLAADPARVRQWRERLANNPGVKVGLVWAGTAGHLNDRARSMSLTTMAPLASVEGVTFYALQKGPPAAQASSPPPGMKLIVLGDDLHDFADTAALLEALDLLISVDTSVVHVAGALARPVWNLLAAGPDWRWMLDREDSPWYPTMRLLRQPEPGNWGAVIERTAADLREWVRTQKENS